MDKFKDKKVIATIIVLTILFISSIILYGKNNNKVFSDKYMQIYLLIVMNKLAIIQ